jgi:integrase
MSETVEISGFTGRRGRHARPVELLSDAPEGVVGVPGGGVDAVRGFQEAASSANTRRGYSTDWLAFTRWCDNNGAVALPAEPLTVASYLAYSANLVDTAGKWFYAPGTLGRWLASINKAHHLAGFGKPGAHPDVETTMSGIRRTRSRPQSRKTPLLLSDLKQALSHIDVTSYPAGVIGHRDYLIMLLGFVGAYRRSELTGFEVRDVQLHAEDGLHVLLRQSKTDQTGRGSVKGLPFGMNPLTCTPCAYVRWVRVLAANDMSRVEVMKVLAAASTSTHVCRGPVPELSALNPRMPVVRPVMKNGTISDRPASGAVVNAVVQRRMAAIGCNAPTFGAHSLRAGFVTQAFRAGATHHEVMRQTGHKNVTTLEIYSRENDPLAHNAVTRLGL